MADRLARAAAAEYLRQRLRRRCSRTALVELLRDQAKLHGDRALATAIEHHDTDILLLNDVEAEVARMAEYAIGALDQYWTEHETELTS